MLPFLVTRLNTMKEIADVYVVIKYVSSNQLGKKVVARGPGGRGCGATLPPPPPLSFNRRLMGRQVLNEYNRYQIFSSVFPSCSISFARERRRQDVTQFLNVAFVLTDEKPAGHLSRNDCVHCCLFHRHLSQDIIISHGR
jgi:hypothetical protein